MKLFLKGTPTKRWGYEQAFASGIILTMARDGDDIRDLEDHLNGQFKRSPDNKTTFEMDNRYGGVTYYVTFHDNTVYVGTSVRPYSGATLPEPQVQ